MGCFLLPGKTSFFTRGTPPELPFLFPVYLILAKGQGQQPGGGSLASPELAEATRAWRAKDLAVEHWTGNVRERQIRKGAVVFAVQG